VVSDYTILAQLGRVSRSRVTQIMNLRNLAPDIQEQILFLKADTAERQGICEKSIRRLSSLFLWNEQRAHWNALNSPCNSHGMSTTPPDSRKGIRHRGNFSLAPD
jgi:hypothetical protein